MQANPTNLNQTSINPTIPTMQANPTIPTDLNQNIKLEILNSVSKLHYNYKLEQINKENNNFIEKLKLLFNELYLKNINKKNASGMCVMLDNYNFSIDEEYYVVLSLKIYFYLNVFIYTGQNSNKYIYFGNSLTNEIELLNKYKI